jgi:hypothetical protein
MNKLSPHFCVAPWTHTYVSPQGERRLCCASREEASFQKQYIDSGTDNNSTFNPASLEEHWNSEYMKDIRKRILAGEKISQCDICNDQILNIHTYKKYFTETLFPHKIDEILNNTDSTGFTTMKPVSYDYRISNLCNFKCRMCGEQLSSSWETEKIKYNKIDFKKDKWLVPETRQQISVFQKTVLEEELQHAVNNNTIEEIYWVGGEPLMMERHWTIMDQLVKSGQSKNVIVRYNTNLSKITYKEYDLYKLLPHFKRVNICASIDGVGDVGEYIRTGLDWNQWLDNFKKGMFLIEQFGDDALVFDVTLTTPGLFDLKQLFDIVTELNVKSYLKITFAFDPSIPMSPLILPRDILKKTVTDLLEYIEPRLTFKNKIYKDVLLDLLKRQTFEEQWPDSAKDGARRAKKTVMFLESARTQELTFEEILPNYAKDWWKNI